VNSAADLHGVIAELKEATAPTWALEQKIAAAVGWTPFRRNWPPCVMSSLDDALLLVPENWFWRVGRTSLFKAWAGVYKHHPDHCDPGRNEFSYKRENFEPDCTPATALCVVALEARVAIIEKRDR